MLVQNQLHTLFAALIFLTSFPWRAVQAALMLIMINTKKRRCHFLFFQGELRFFLFNLLFEIIYLPAFEDRSYRILVVDHRALVHELRSRFRVAHQRLEQIGGELVQNFLLSNFVHPRLATNNKNNINTERKATLMGHLFLGNYLDLAHTCTLPKGTDRVGRKLC